MSSSVQATHVSFELHTLGWKAFQSLSLTIMSEILGQTVQGFFDSHDGGRDGAFYGRWKIAEGEELSGSFTTQCKFTSKPNGQMLLSALSGEIEKATRLAQRGLADNYLILTNAHITGTAEAEIRARFEALPGIKRCLAYGKERISQFIQESPRLRMLVPRVYGLGDLSQILDERAQSQAQEILSALGGDLDKFVLTEAYRRSAKALTEHRFVLLLGEPACGKSTIAAALSMGALDEWGCSTIKARDASDFVTHWNPHDAKQFFWIDDAFGATQLHYSSIAAWNSAMSHIQAATKRGTCVLLTSRDYIYRAAREHLKETAFPLLREAQVVINVQDLTKGEREQILYNHIRLGSQSKTFKSRLKPFLPQVVERKNFSPEVARRLGNPVFTRHLHPTQRDVIEFVDEPEELLKDNIRTLDVNIRSALALVFMRGGSVESPISLSPDESNAIRLLGSDLAGVRAALTFLDGSFMLRTVHEGTTVWKYKHPTIRDAFASLVAEDPELLDIYLAGTPALTLFQEVSCGGRRIDGEKVTVPPSRYHVIIDRIGTANLDKHEHERALHWFLSARCSDAFLAAFLTARPAFIGSLHVGSYLSAVSDINVLVRLHEAHLLPEPKRLNVVARLQELAVETPDAGFLHHDVNSLLTEEELAKILLHVRTTLIPELAEHIESARTNWDRKEAPEAAFHELESALKVYRRKFADDSEFCAAIDIAFASIATTIVDMNDDLPLEPDLSDMYTQSAVSVHAETRSIFDDVDQ